MKSKRLLALLLSALMILQCTITSTVFAADVETVVYEEDFESANDGIATKVGKAEAKIVNDADYGKSLMLRTTDAAGDKANFAPDFSRSMDKSGTISFSVKFNKSNDWTSIYFGGSLNLYISSGRLGSHLGTSQPNHATLTPGEWHDIDVNFDVPAGVYTVSVDYEVVAKDVKFRSASAFKGVTINIDKVNNEFYFDNFRVTYKNSTAGKKVEAPKEEPKVEAPAVTEPERTMIEAAEGETITVAKADTYIGMSGRTSAQGHNGSVLVSHDNYSNEKMAFFKFDAPEVPDGKKAYLNLWLQGASYNFDKEIYTVFATETNWDEDLYYADDPIKLTDTVGRKVFAKDAAKQWIKIDVTDYVKANAGKEISLSLRGTNADTKVSAGGTLTFDSRSNICKPNILVCDPIAELEPVIEKGEEMDVPKNASISFAGMSNVNKLDEINMLVIGGAKADIAKYDDIYGDFADKVAAATGAKVNYINKAAEGLDQGAAVSKAGMLTEDQVADLVVADFDDLSEDQAIAIVNRYRGFNKNAEFVFVTNEKQFESAGEGTVLALRSELIGANITDVNGGAVKSYVAGPTEKWDIKAKAKKDVVDLVNFDNYSDNNIGQAMVIENQDHFFNIEDDKLIGGKYLRIKKDTYRGKVDAKYFATTMGGNLRFDFQFCLFDIDSKFNISMWPTARDSHTMDKLFVEGGAIKCGFSSPKTVYSGVKANQWYNVAILYDMDANLYDVIVDGTVVAEDLVTNLIIGNICSYEIGVAEGETADFAIDGIRTSYYTKAEMPAPKVVEETEEDEGPAVIFDDDFEGRKVGIIEKGSSGDVSYVREDGNTFIRATRTTGTGSCTTMYNFGQTKGDVTVDLDFRLGDTGGATKLMYIMSGNNFAVPLYFSGSNLQLNLSNTERPIVKSGLKPKQWYHMTVTTDLANSQYSVNIDGEDVGPFDLLGGATYFDKVRIAISAGENSTYDVDNLKVEKLNEIAKVDGYSKIAGYDPANTDAPANNEWTEKYRRNPTAEIYEAEDMKLDGFVKYKDLNYHNEYGVKTVEEGCGIAEFTYTGESGYKQIHYGYLEDGSVGAEDTFYYLYQNGKLIDWIVCQNDEVGRYNRVAKEWWYVEKGDKFMIRGSYGKDPAQLDYVEFDEGIKREFKVGDLVGEANRAQGYRLSSGWDLVDNAGGWASQGLVLRDTSTNDAINLERRLPEFFSPFMIEFQYIPFTHSYFDILVGNMTAGKNKYPIKMSVEGNNLIIDGKTYENVFKSSGASHTRIDVDTYSKTYEVVIDSKVIVSDVPFACDIDAFSVFRFVSEKETKSFFRIYPFAIKAGYVMNEDFRCESDNNIELYNWEVTGKTGVAQDNAENVDPWHRVITPSTTIKRSFRPQTGVITFETQIIFKTKRDGSRVEIGNSEGGNIALFTKDGDIWYDAGNGKTGVIWEDFMTDVWYEYKLEIDMNNHKCLFHVNSFQKVDAEITPAMTKADYTMISSDKADGDFWVDDIVVFNGTYNDDNEVPEPEPPKGYGDYNIVMQTCDMWREGTHFGYDCLHPFATRTPFLGYLEEGNPEVSDWQNKWMIDHGINVFTPCWYMPNDAKSAPKNPRNGYSLDQGFMNSKYQDQIEFAIKLTYAGVNEGEENWLKYYVAYWIEHYFKHPSYFKVDNKPVIFCFNTSEFTSKWGQDTARVLERAREMCREAGFDGALFLSCNGAERVFGWDYGYKYCYTGIANGYAGAITTALKMNENLAVNTPWIFTMSQGWGDEAWGRNCRKLNMNLDDWKATAEWARDVYLPSMPQDDELTSKTITLGNWNEYCEGHTLAPSNITGFGYLDMIREVFYPDAEPHEDIKPDKKWDQMSAMLW